MSSERVTETEEDFLPPPELTKSMLAKFQTMEAEAEKEANVPARRKVMHHTVVVCAASNSPSVLFLFILHAFLNLSSSVSD